MSRVMVDSSVGCEGLVVAGGVEREFADEFSVGCDDADGLVGDEELDLASFVGSADADVVEPARVAQADLAVRVDGVVADPEVCRGLRGRWFGLQARAVGL